jgi:hypothetical protein
MKTKRILMAVALAICAMVITGSMRAENFDNPRPGAPKWKVIDYNRVQTHPARVPDKITGGISFDFLNTPDTALLATSHPSYNGSLLGDLTGKTVSATVGVTVTPGAQFQYYGEGQPGDCGTPANVRLYFQTDTGGKFEETDYWWSNPVSADLATLTPGGDQTISESLANPHNWTDFYGHHGDDPLYSAGFAQAAADVQMIGLSFGGGCFFENGVGIQPGTGSGSFRLMDFSVTP